MVRTGVVSVDEGVEGDGGANVGEQTERFTDSNIQALVTTALRSGDWALEQHGVAAECVPCCLHREEKGIN